jgi:Zn-dependent protease with chaperone function
MESATSAEPSTTAMTPLEALRGRVTRPRTGPLYTAGLAVVAVAMVLLPLIYVGLIALLVWGVVVHLTVNTWIVNDMAGGASRLVLYLGPAIVGGILAFFMVKPLFAPRAKPPESVRLDPEGEPLLFAFTERICELVGARPPSAIHVDGQVNASASLRRGVWSRELGLTIGLPLVAGLDMRELAGVLAHEFGHFAQGAGMRLTYVIRSINGWFAAVVYGRDRWDARLEKASAKADFRLGIVLYAARAGVWVSRRILWALMQAGHAISCFMLRQMEYDADRCEARIAGADAFEATMVRMGELDVASRMAFGDVQQSWDRGRLPEDLPLLIGHRADLLPADVRAGLARAAASGRTGWFDTHPSEADRIRAVRRHDEPGIFDLDAPASDLFADFEGLSRRVTRHEYAERFGLVFDDEMLMPTDEVLRDSAAKAQADAMCDLFYGPVDISAWPLVVEPGPPPTASASEAAEAWRLARDRSEALRPEAEAVAGEFEKAQRRIARLVAGRHLLQAGFVLPPEDFGLRSDAVTAEDQAAAVKVGLQDAYQARRSALAVQAPFVAALRDRVAHAMAAAAHPDGSPADTTGGLDPAELRRLLAAVGQEMDGANELAELRASLHLVLQNQETTTTPPGVDAYVAELSQELVERVQGIQDRLAGLTWPLDPGAERVAVAEYLRSGSTAESPVDRAWAEATSHVDGLFRMNFRLTGLALAMTHAAEAALEPAVPDAAPKPAAPDAAVEVPAGGAA